MTNPGVAELGRDYRELQSERRGSWGMKPK